MKTTTWSGGTTTELLIFPKKADFKERDFDFRISIATIEVDESDFTPLENYNRCLFVLEGEMEIIHENHYSKKLNTFDYDEFHGSWKTKSIGKVRDFNIIYNSKFELTFSKESFLEDAVIERKSDFLFIFSLKDTRDFENKTFHKYDLLEVEKEAISLRKGSEFLKIELNKKVIR